MGLVHHVLAIAISVTCLAGPVGAQPLTAEEARHLLARTGFGAAHIDRIRAFTGLDRAAAVDRLLDGVRDDPSTPLPAFIRDRTFTSLSYRTGFLQFEEGQRTEEGYDDYEMTRGLGIKQPAHFLADSPLQDQAVACKQRQQICDELAKWWWFREMIVTPSPLTEKMVLFWHGHFSTSMRDVGNPSYMMRQNALFRDYAIGSFHSLLWSIITDPAMMISLNIEENYAHAPNENFGRELLELFTLGEGHYTERDIREVTRALTGFQIDNMHGTAFLDPALHDGGDKTIFGETGRFGRDQVVDLILAHPRAAVFLAERIWQTFISHTPDPAEVDRLAKVLRDAGYEIRALLRAVLLSDAFWDPANRGALVKSPVDLVVGTARMIGLDHVHPVMGFPKATMLAGQDLLDPPRVNGWPDGVAWLSAAGQAWRENLLRRFLGGPRERAPGEQMMTVAAGSDDGALPAALSAAVAVWQDSVTIDLVTLAVPAMQPADDGLVPLDRTRHNLLDLAYQVK